MTRKVTFFQTLRQIKQFLNTSALICGTLLLGIVCTYTLRAATNQDTKELTQTHLPTVYELAQEPCAVQSAHIDHLVAQLAADTTGLHTSMLQESIIDTLSRIHDYQLQLVANTQEQELVAQVKKHLEHHTLLRPLLCIITLEVLRTQLGIDQSSLKTRMSMVYNQVCPRNIATEYEVTSDMIWHAIATLFSKLPPYNKTKTTHERLAFWGNVASIALKLTIVVSIGAGLFYGYKVLSEVKEVTGAAKKTNESLLILAKIWEEHSRGGILRILRGSSN